MRRWIAVITLLVLSLLSATPAEAFHHRHFGWGGGWGGGWGHRGWGWGGGFNRGFGWGPGWGPGWGYGGWGYRGFGGPIYGVGFYQPIYSFPAYSPMCSPWFGAVNYGGAVNVGMPVSVGSPVYASTPTRGPTVTLIATSAQPVGSASIAGAPALAARPIPNAVALQQFLGMNELSPVNLASPRPALASRPAATYFVAHYSNVESRRKAERMIAEADELFKTQNFHSALQRYKLAGTTAPDFAEPFWRQGHALIATHNYEQAATAFKRAIALTDDLSRGGFRLNDIYGGAAMTKSHHLESLAEWAVNKRNSPDSYFLLGLFLEYDGQEARAEKFFNKASDLAGISGGHIGVFLDPAEPVLLKFIERTPAKPAVTMPVVAISSGRDI